MEYNLTSKCLVSNLIQNPTEIKEFDPNAKLERQEIKTLTPGNFAKLFWKEFFI